jgi:hypothetical protein
MRFQQQADPVIQTDEAMPKIAVWPAICICHLPRSIQPSIDAVHATIISLSSR